MLRKQLSQSEAIDNEDESNLGTKLKSKKEKKKNIFIIFDSIYNHDALEA